RRRGARRAGVAGGAAQRGGGGAGDDHGQPGRLLAQRRQGLGAGQPAANPLWPQAAPLIHQKQGWCAHPGDAEELMTAPHGFSWVEKPLLAALGRPGSAEEMTWLRQQGIEVLLSLTEERPRRDWSDEAGLLVFHEPLEDMEAPTQEQLDRAV